MKKLTFILLTLISGCSAAFAQTPTSPVQLTTNSAYYEPSSLMRWFYNGLTYGWWKPEDTKNKITSLTGGLVSNTTYLSSLGTANAIYSQPWKTRARIITTTNITLSGIFTYNGTAISDQNIILVNGQTDATTNGLYIAEAAGAWVRNNDSNTGANIATSVVAISGDDVTNGTTIWQNNNASVIVGTTNIHYVKIIGSGSGVSSFNGRTDAVVPLVGDYSSFYGSLSQQNTNTTNIAANTTAIALKLNISDTSAMLGNVVHKALTETITGQKTLMKPTTIGGAYNQLPFAFPYTLDVVSDWTNRNTISMRLLTAGPVSNRIVFNSALGTIASPTAVTSGTDIGVLTFSGWNGSNFSNQSAGIKITTTQDATTSHAGASMSFSTTANNAASTTTALLLDQDKSAYFYGAIDNYTFSSGAPGIKTNFLNAVQTGVPNYIGGTLNIGTTSNSSNMFNVQSDGVNMLAQFSGFNHVNNIHFTASNGSQAAPRRLKAGDNGASWGFQPAVASNDVSNSTIGTSNVAFEVTELEDQTATQNGVQFQIQTTLTGTSAASRIPNFTLNADGIGGATVYSTFTAPGQIKAANFSTGASTNGYYETNTQASNPATPSSGFRLFANSGNMFSWVSSVSGHAVSLNGTLNTLDRQYVFPDSAGRIAIQPWVVGQNYVKSISLTTSGVLYSTPVTFTVTNGAATGALALNTQTANTVLAGPTSGGVATPTFRALVAADIPALPYGTGTVTSASVVTSNGVSATVATATTTPAFTFTLGAITPSSITTSGVSALNGGVTTTSANGYSSSNGLAGASLRSASIGYNLGGSTPSVDIYSGTSYSSYRYNQFQFYDGTNITYVNAPTISGTNTLTLPNATGTLLNNVTLTTSGVLYSTPINFTVTADGKASGALSLVSQAAYTIFGNNTNASATPAFFVPTLASALFQNQGTTTTVLHGNGSGNPSWGSIGINDVSGSTGTGSFVFGTAPTFTTSITNPLWIGGTGTTSTAIIRSTSGVGAAGADIVFQTGNNGGTEAMRILNNGNIGIGISPTQQLQITGNFLAGGSVQGVTSYFQLYEPYDASSDMVFRQRNAAKNFIFQNSGGTAQTTIDGATGKITLATGSNKSQGSATLVGGTVTISNTAVTASSKIFFSRTTAGGTIAELMKGTIVAGTSFVVNSTTTAGALNTADTSTFDWWITD